MAGIINWEALMELTMPKFPPKTDRWDKFAVRYNGFAGLEQEYTARQIEAMQLEPGDTVLDVGAGPGRISIPVAGRVKGVTALDASKDMQAVLLENANKVGRSNITCLNIPWEEAVIGGNVPVHDVVVASRSPGIKDLKKLDAAARKFVYIMTFIGSSLKDFHDELLEGIIETPKIKMPKGSISHHAITFNRLCDMGIDASVQYVKDGFTRWYESREAAYDDFHWLDVPPEKVGKFRENLDHYLFPENQGVRLLRETKTVIIWWKKET